MIKHIDLQMFGDSRKTWKNLLLETVKTEYKYTRECTYYAGLQVSGEELNTYENGKHMEVMRHKEGDEIR